MVRCNTECPPRRGRRRVVRANAGVAAWVSTFEESMPPNIGAAMGLIPLGGVAAAPRGRRNVYDLDPGSP
ncbi:MAG: hypothetical protein V5B44_16055 [Candidatus Accumulibacter necessarius]|uniref:hypothetical protein n=1 Tax=Candidatus Accumulibacter necessarius TaxID=2954386 RepID=UPI002FC3AFBF